MELFNEAITWANSIVWSNVLVVICLVAGIYFSVRLKFPQIRMFKEMIRLLLKADPNSQSGITPFQAFATTVGSRVGMGSVAGVATGIYFGGPALFIERGLGIKVYAVLFALATILGPGILMPGLHANSVASTFQRSFGTSMIAGGIILCVFLAVVVFGGVKRIGEFSEKAAPIMCLIYMLMAIGIVVIYYKNIPGVIGTIISSAFGQNAVYGGILGSAIAWGVKRGVYSTEAGQGSGAIVSAAAEVSHPAKQGLVQALSVYIVSFVVCTSTAVILLLSNSYNVLNETTGQMITEYLPGSQYGVGWTQDILESTYGSLLGGKLFAIIIVLFVFTSLIGYEYQAESNVNYLFKGKKAAVWLIRGIFILSTFSGVLVNADIIWTMGDTGAGLMTWLNIFAVALLSKKAFAIFKDYEKQKKQGLDPVFHPEQFGIDDSEGIWKVNQESEEK